MKRYNATERVTDVVFPEEVKRRQRRARKGGVNWNEPVDRPTRDERSVPDPSRGPTRGRAPRVFLRE
jgi:endonuclease/exonuclease/phosphatase family metal-dependent hydrolase